MNKKILVIVAHRDDEVLGAGATIKKHSMENDEVSCLFLGDDELCRESRNLNDEAQRSGRILGIKEIYFENLPDNKFDSIPLLEIIQKIEKYLEKIKPDIVYTHFENDLNIDHKKTFEAVVTACRPCNTNCPREIYCFEILSSTEWQLTENIFLPNVFIDIKDTIEYKMQALKEYKSEIRNYPHPRSIEGVEILARYRGLECGKKYTEAFKLIRQIK